MARLEAEFGDALRVEWRAFLLRPTPQRGVRSNAFAPTPQSWLRPAAEPDAPSFRPWASDAGPPSHSIPAHLVAKAAAAVGPDAFAAMHRRLLRAYFEESLDVTDRGTQRTLWSELGLADDAFAVVDAPATRDDRARRASRCARAGCHRSAGGHDGGQRRPDARRNAVRDVSSMDRARARPRVSDEIASLYATPSEIVRRDRALTYASA